MQSGAIPQKSLPPRGAWIEIAYAEKTLCIVYRSLPPRGAWIEIAADGVRMRVISGRSPHGERGLKLYACLLDYPKANVAPPTGSVD